MIARRIRVPRRSRRARTSPLPAAMILATGLIVSLAGPAAGATIHVSCPADDLTTAIAGANDGDTVVIDGICVGNFVVNERITLSGRPGAILDGGAAGTTLTTNASRVRVEGLTITGGVDRTLSFGGGGVLNLGRLTITRSAVAGNSAPLVGGVGGGIANGVGATLVVRDSVVSGNSANGDGGGIRNDGELTIVRSTLSGNAAQSGGAISTFGDVTVSRSSLSGNEATLFGGGIFAIGAVGGSVTVAASTFRGNTAGSNGGAIDDRGTVSVARSTLTGNSAPLGGAVSNVGSGSTFSLSASTVSGNTASTTGGGIHTFTGTTTVGSSIVAGNTAPTGPDCTGSPISNGYNLVGDADGCSFGAAVGDRVGASSGSGVIDPQLAPLAMNGGPTRTMAPAPASPAIDRIPVGSLGADGATPMCSASGTRDQRGEPRPRGSGCDIGAFERQP